jgi:DNA-binding NarL/FixJ family response regulator
MIKLILVDDDGFFRLGVRMTLELDHPDIIMAGEAGSGDELFALLADITPDIILLDIDLPGMSGIDIARRLKRERPEIKILALSGTKATQVIQSMLETGVEGFVRKPDRIVDTIAEAIRTVAQGLEYFGKDISEIMYRIYVAKKKTAEITPEFTEQEKRIIELCRDGLLGKEIANRLEISLKTVNNHKSNIFRKLGINTTMEMVNYALKNGIINV